MFVRGNMVCVDKFVTEKLHKIEKEKSWKNQSIKKEQIKTKL